MIREINYMIPSFFRQVKEKIDFLDNCVIIDLSNETNKFMEMSIMSKSTKNVHVNKYAKSTKTAKMSKAVEKRVKAAKNKQRKAQAQAESERILNTIDIDNDKY